MSSLRETVCDTKGKLHTSMILPHIDGVVFYETKKDSNGRITTVKLSETTVQRDGNGKVVRVIKFQRGAL